MEKYFIIYKTENCLNGRFYIGAHETVNMDDGYLGSGRRLKAEIRKYGRENFKRVVLEVLSSRNDMLRREAEIVTEELRKDPLCLNLKNGGEGGWQYVNQVGANIRDDFARDDVYRQKMSNAKRGTVLSAIARKAIADGNWAKKNPEEHRAHMKKIASMAKSEEHKEKFR